nr:immunoglobulin light chain junction region [Macaca mulatta]MOV74550.1 immunoglobulin light chain junction region [Macaca mulatta]MOV75064.1 immunoglobulin light chain junction region [Macaca mulatta]MOV75276.1 immunoglobulin light chain junction region [Macaca mulatta]MOV75470.1 immunoglobulin light chain junction region [Macaca mulatta]
CMQGLEFPISF